MKKWVKKNLWWMVLVSAICLVSFYPRRTEPQLILQPITDYNWAEAQIEQCKKEMILRALEEISSKPNPWEAVQVVKVVVEGENEDTWYNNWQGTGVFIADNLILTAGHIVDGAENITVVFPDGNEYPATEWYLETEADLGIIEVNTPNIELVAVFDNAIVGEDVWAYGNPLGIFPILTRGIVSAIDMPDTFTHTKRMVITDAAINPGNSGSPLFNKNGNILGICSWGYINSDGMSYFVRAEICQLMLNKYQAIKALKQID